MCSSAPYSVLHSGHMKGLWGLEKSLIFEVGQILGKSLNLSEARFPFLLSTGDSPPFGEYMLYECKIPGTVSVPSYDSI